MIVDSSDTLHIIPWTEEEGLDPWKAELAYIEHMVRSYYILKVDWHWDNVQFCWNMTQHAVNFMKFNHTTQWPGST